MFFIALSPNFFHFSQKFWKYFFFISRKQFRKFGDTSVRILLEPDGRVAFVYFRNHDEAKEAFNSKINLIFYDKAANIKPVIECHTEDTDGYKTILLDSQKFFCLVPRPGWKYLVGRTNEWDISFS